jgi:enamine deaminase RidA (YjgF/YER057c/UK114 family)
MRAINPKGVWNPATGPDARATKLPVGWSQVALKGKFVFIAGQVGATAKGEMPLDLRSQLKLTYQNIDKCLKAAGATWQDVLYTTVFATSLDTEFYTTWREVQAKYIPAPPFPAMTGVGCTRLTWPNQKVEIEVIAVKD